MGRGTALRSSGELLERTVETAALEQLLADAAGGAGGALMFEGPAGIGKTALLDAARRLAATRGLRVLGARAGELEADFAFGVVRQLFAPVMAEEDGDLLVDGAAAHAQPALAPTAGGAAAASASAPTAVLHGLHWLTAKLAEREPLLLLVDDAHWGDAVSLQWLDYIARRLDSLPVALVVALRPEGAAALELEARLAQAPGTRLLRPMPLTEAAVAEWVASELAAEAEPEFVRACHAATAGNAFYLRELLRSVRERGLEPTGAGAARLEAVSPGSIASAVLLRLASAAPAAGAVARAVAVLGDHAESRHVAALAGISAAQAGEAADALAAADLLTHGRPFAFVHPIVREAVYGSLPGSARSRAHARAAEILRADGAPPLACGIHLLAVEPAGDAGVVASLEAAAREALQRGAPAEAAALLRRALQEPPPPPERPALLHALGQAEALTHDPRAIEHLRAAAADGSDPQRRALAGLDLGRLLAYDPTAARDAYDVLQSALRDADRETALRIEAELAVARWHLADLVPLLEGSLARHADLEGEAPVERLLLGLLAYERVLLGEPTAGPVALARRALADGVLLADQGGISTAYMMIVCVLLVGDELDEARAQIDHGLADARSRGDALDFAMASGFRSHTALRAGDVAVAEADGRSALDLALELGVGLLVPMFAAYLVEALVDADRLDEADAVVQSTGLDGDLPFEIFSALFIHLAVGRLLLARGRAGEAAERLMMCTSVEERWGPITPGVVPWRSWAAMALGPGEKGAQLAAEELRRARATGTGRAIGIAEHASALTATGADRERLLRDAVATLAASPDRLSHARALSDLGAELRESGRVEEAQRELRAALDLAHRCGARLVEERCRGELRATGARPRRPALTGPSALTESERRVAQLGARGLSNVEIAQSLFITIKTVEGHLARAYRKLGIGSRRQLVEALRRPTGR